MFELVLVIAIIAIIAVNVIPTLLRARMNANEASTIGSLRAVVGAQTDYNNNSLPHQYADSLEELATGSGAGGVGFLEDLRDGIDRGYVFEIVWANQDGWAATAVPAVLGRTGERSFHTDETGIILELDPCPPRQADEEADCSLRPGSGVLSWAARTLVGALARLTPKDPVNRAVDLTGEAEELELLLKEMDANSDGLLTLAEISDGEPLEVARRFLAATDRTGQAGRGGSAGKEVGDDEAITRLTDTYLRWLRGNLQLGAGGEEVLELPGLAIDELSPDAPGQVQSWLRDSGPRPRPEAAANEAGGSSGG